MLPPTKKLKINPLFMKVIVISVALHVIAGFVATIITVANIVIQEDTQFEEPPAVAEEEPPPPVKVQIKPQQPKPQQAQRLTMRPVANIAVANIDVNLPSMDQNFTVSAGLGGMGGGSLLGGTRGNIGMGLSDVSVFGLKTRAERILFVIDANRHMVIDSKGGLNSYKVIKDEITDMVGNLSAGTLYNVMLYNESYVKMFKPQLVPAGSESHQELIRWIAPINSDANKVGLPGAKRGELKSLKDTHLHESLYKHGGWANTNIFITQFTLEQSVDAIFVITGYHRGAERARMALTDAEEKKWRADWARTQASSAYKKQMEKHNAEVPVMKKRIADEMAKINKERQSKGQPPRVLKSGTNVWHQAKELELKWKTQPINPSYPVKHFEERHVIKYYKDLIKTLYKDKDLTPPSVNVVLFLAGDENFTPQWKNSLNSFVRMFSGKSRIIRGLDEIKSARSSAETTN